MGPQRENGPDGDNYIKSGALYMSENCWDWLKMNNAFFSLHLLSTWS